MRSLKFVEQGDYLLQETALLLKNGTVQTFMESVFPRANLVPQGYKPLEADANSSRWPTATASSAANASSSRSKSKPATRCVCKPVRRRFNLGDSGTIDWYITPNIPDKIPAGHQSGVEGWNRYFEPQLGRKVMRFLGKLAAGVKLGDPRYNVINFDSVAQAGAAYESQAIDPMTGIQSHSLIYMPYAWYNIGIDLWKNRTDTYRRTAEQLTSQMLAPERPRE